MFLKGDCVRVSAVKGMSAPSILALNFEWRICRYGNENICVLSEITPNVLDTERNGTFHAEFWDYIKKFRGSQLLNVYCTCLIILLAIKQL
jgi:hypothetical protein